MSESPSSTDSRAKWVALFGFILQLLSLVALATVAWLSESDAIASGARFFIIGLPIWLVLFLVFNQMQRVESEKLETEELRRSQEAGASAAIFEVGDDNLLIEQGRLRWLVRWQLPAVTVLLSMILLGGEFLFWDWSLQEAFTSGTLDRTKDPTLMMWFVIGIGFFNFLYARYALALARLPNWRLLRAGASCMAGNALVCLGLAIALMAGTTITWTEPLIAYLVRIVLLVLGLEFATNFVLDFYRPRTSDGVPRPSFESRLLSLISEPGGIAKSIADTINYQFGFEVSSTWFYQLLQRWLVPIMVATFIAVLGLTSVVIVDSGEQVVVERFGRILGGRAAVLEPGIHIKWPFPIDISYRAPSKRISEIVLGEAEENEEHAHQAILWTEAHEFVPELLLLVASPKDEGDTESTAANAAPAEDITDIGGESVAVSLLEVSVPIEYRIKDIRKFLYRHLHPIKVLEAIGYQYLSDYAASVDLDELMGPGREAFNRRLHGLLQKRLDQPDLDLGIEIVFVGIRGAHPPAKDGVAKTFQAVVSAQVNRGAMIGAAESKAMRILTAVAGSKHRADELDAAIVARDALHVDSKADPQAIKEAAQRVEDLLVGNAVKRIAPLSGNAAALIEEAKGRATEMVSVASNKARAFATEVAAYEAAPQLYKQRKRLEVYEGISEIRKFLIVGDPSDILLIYNTKEQGGLDAVLKEATGDGR